MVDLLTWLIVVYFHDTSSVNTYIHGSYGIETTFFFPVGKNSMLTGVYRPKLLVRIFGNHQLMANKHRWICLRIFKQVNIFLPNGSLMVIYQYRK